MIYSLKGLQAAPLGRTIPFNQPSSDKFEAGESRQELRGTVISKKLKRWLITALSAVIFIVGTFAVYKIIESSRKNDVISKLEKSIALLPFVNDSPDQENTYFINGLMDEILNNLQKIKDFRVLSRTSTEQYRGTNKPTIPKIAKDLDVNYIVEGSCQKYGNTFRLRVQLIAAKNEKHIWGDSYEQEIQNTKDIFKIQSQVAQAIAKELKASITPEEKQSIEKIPTTNLSAYDFYLRGNEEALKFWLDNFNKQALVRAEELYKEALKLDSTLASAYSALATLYVGKYSDPSNLSLNYLDSALFFANRALAYDDHLSDAYYIRGDYYINKGNFDRAIKEYEIAIKYDPNNAMAYLHLGFASASIDVVKALEVMHTAVKISHGSDRAIFLRFLGIQYALIGFPQQAKSYCQEALKIGGDTSLYLNTLGQMEFYPGNYEKAFKHINKVYLRDTSKFENIGWMAYSFFALNKYDESLKYALKIKEQLKSVSIFTEVPILYIGYVYLMNGYTKEADFWFEKLKSDMEQSIQQSNVIGNGAYGGLAVYYAIKGDKKKMYKNLTELSKRKICDQSTITSIKNAPYFNNVRNEPEFQKIVSNLESKYHAEHDRVQKWLEDQGMLSKE
jgi:TolB-like protein/Tfp pilus assembly protein PilF